MILRIPRNIPLPGFPVKVKLVREGVLVKDSNADSDYGPSGGIIRIRKSLPLKMQRYCLVHELQHLLIDFLHILLQEEDLIKDEDLKEKKL
jgi:Zn-dependent peptidase ImmA (M78 family)